MQRVNKAETYSVDVTGRIVACSLHVDILILVEVDASIATAK